MIVKRLVKRLSWLNHQPRKYRTTLPQDSLPPAEYCREAYFLARTESAIRKGGPARALSAHLLWRLALPLLVASEIQKHGASTKEKWGIEKFRQWLLGLRLCWGLPATPQDLYTYRLLTDKSLRNPHTFFNYHCNYNFISVLVSGQDIEEAAPLQNKALAFRHGLDHGLPFHGNLATYSDGTWQGDQEFGSGDIFVKELDGTHGKGAMAWRRTADGSFSDGTGRHLTAAELRSLLEEREVAGWVVQERLENHPTVRALCGETLATLRIVTVLNESLKPEALGAVFRMPSSRESVVDNFSSGGIAASVDLVTGTLGAATTKGMSGQMEVHPITGQPIRGFALPRFGEAIALAIRAHEAFMPRVYVGWDIAVAPTRLLLVEGNGSPDVDLHQIIDRTPLGEMRFGMLLKHHVQNALHARASRDGRALRLQGD